MPVGVTVEANGKYAEVAEAGLMEVLATTGPWVKILVTGANEELMRLVGDSCDVEEDDTVEEDDWVGVVADLVVKDDWIKELFVEASDFVLNMLLDGDMVENVRFLVIGSALSRLVGSISKLKLKKDNVLSA